MDKKININDAFYGLCSYKGAVTIEYYTDFNHKKYINKYNSGDEALFSNIVRFLRGDDAKNLDRPSRVQLFYKDEGSTDLKGLTSAINYTTSPTLYEANKQTDGTYAYTLSTNISKANCITYSFILTRGNYLEPDKKIDTIKLLGGNDNKVFATIKFNDEEDFKVDPNMNMQIY